MSREYLRKEEVLTLWGQIVDSFCSQAQASVLASGIGQAMALAQDNAENIVLHDGRISDLESCFDGSAVKLALKSNQFTTARTLWGQSFDGTANVSGKINDTGDILPDADSTRSIGYTNNKYQEIAVNAVLTNKNTGMYFHASQGTARFTWFDSTSNTSDSHKLMWLSSAGDLALKHNMEAEGGVSGGGIADLAIIGGIYPYKMKIYTTGQVSAYTLLTDDVPTYDAINNSSDITISVPTLNENTPLGIMHTLRITRGSGSAITVNLPRTSGASLSVIRPANSITVNANTTTFLRYFYTRQWIAQAYIWQYQVNFVGYESGYISTSN